MNKRVIIVIALLIVIITAIGLTLLLLNQQQDLRSRADTPDTVGLQQQSGCQAPPAPGGVGITYPNDTGGQSDFSQANCKWDTVTGATSYAVKITEQDSGTVVKNESVTVTNIVFPVTNGRTYQCDVTATNSCGATGATGTDSLLCQTDVAAVTPTVGPSTAPSATPVPTTPVQPTATPVPQIVTYSCGQVGCSATNPCIAGLQCVPASNGQSYCAYPIYASACQQSPSSTSCCSAPAQPRPTLPPSGDSKAILLFSAGGVALVIIGSLLFLL